MTDALLSALQDNHRPPPSSRFWFQIVDDRPPPLIADIKVAVMDHFGVSKKDLTSHRRAPSRARMVGMYLAYKLTDHSHTVIGRNFKRADHTTSLRAYKEIGRRISKDDTLAADVAAVEARFA
jgi:chromosomal replication initiation ATPase DnaA